MNFFDAIDLEDFTSVEGLFFPEGEVVEFFIKNLKENPQYGNLVVETDVASGEFSGKPYAIKLSNKPSPSARKQLLSFLLAFFTKDQLMKKEFSLASLVGQRFKARAGRPNEYDGKKFQRFDSFVRLEAVASADDFSIV